MSTGEAEVHVKVDATPPLIHHRLGLTLLSKFEVTVSLERDSHAVDNVAVSLRVRLRARSSCSSFPPALPPPLPRLSAPLVLSQSRARPSPD